MGYRKPACLDLVQSELQWILKAFRLNAAVIHSERLNISEGSAQAPKLKLNQNVIECNVKWFECNMSTVTGPVLCWKGVFSHAQTQTQVARRAVSTDGNSCDVHHHVSSVGFPEVQHWTLDFTLD